MMLAPSSVLAPSALLALVAFVAAPATAANETCTCKHIDILQAELRNAMRLKKNFAAESEALRDMAQEPSVAVFREFAEGPASRAGLENVGVSKSVFVYYPYGKMNREDSWAENSMQKNCSLLASGVQELDTVTAEAACAGIGAAVRAHEMQHINQCMGMGIRRWIGQHGSALALAEVQAYEVHIAMLRSELQRVLGTMKVVLEMTSTMRAAAPPNPMFTAMTIHTEARLDLNAVPPVASGEVPLVFEGAGEQRGDASIEGNCKVDGGGKFSTPVQVNLSTDGLEARITSRVGGTVPGFSAKCDIPGAGSGFGMSLPISVSGGWTQPRTMALGDGVAQNFAEGPESVDAAARAGVRITGERRVVLNLACRAP